MTIYDENFDLVKSSVRSDVCFYFIKKKFFVHNIHYFWTNSMNKYFNSGHSYQPNKTSIWKESYNKDAAYLSLISYYSLYHFCHGFLKVILMLTLQIFALNHVLCPIFFFMIAYHIRTKQIKRCC